MNEWMDIWMDENDTCLNVDHSVLVLQTNAHDLSVHLLLEMMMMMIDFKSSFEQTSFNSFAITPPKMKYNQTPHHITSHHTTPHHTTPHHTTLHHTTPHYITPHHTTPHHTTPHYITPHHTTPHHTTPHHTTPPTRDTGTEVVAISQSKVSESSVWMCT